MNMKKIISLLILAALALALVGCSGHEDTPDPNAAAEPTATPDLTDILTSSATNAAGAKTPPASGTDAQQTQDGAVPQAVQEAYEKARSCIGLPVTDLYAAVGQPIGEATYGPSCLQVDAEDGMLPYDGFSVWTVRSATAETVHDVFLNE